MFQSHQDLLSHGDSATFLTVSQRKQLRDVQENANYWKEQISYYIHRSTQVPRHDVNAYLNESRHCLENSVRYLKQLSELKKQYMGLHGRSDR